MLPASSLICSLILYCYQYGNPPVGLRGSLLDSSPAAMALSADVVRLTNCRLILPSSIEARDLWIDTKTGRILDPQSTFFTDRKAPARTVDLEGRLIAPGFIDLQLNGCFGIDFGAPQSLDEEYAAAFTRAKVELLKGGVTSFAPTVISTGLEAYRKVRLRSTIAEYYGTRGTHHEADGIWSI